MAPPTSKPDPYDEGYPRSSEADLDPGPDLSESLDDADRAVSGEHRVLPDGRRPHLSTDDGELYGEADDVYDAESRH